MPDQKTSLRPRGRPRRPTEGASAPRADLRGEMLKQARRLLDDQGIEAVSVRAVARESGVSHAAPKNHFGDLGGLLSDLAAQGFTEFGDSLRAAGGDENGNAANDTGPNPASRADRIGLAYVEFARQHRNMFLLMFRHDGLQWERPSLREASQKAFGALASLSRPEGGAVVDAKASGESKVDAGESADRTIPLPVAARMARSWAIVHGYAMLLIDGRLDPVLARIDEQGDEGWRGLLQGCLQLNGDGGK